MKEYIISLLVLLTVSVVLAAPLPNLAYVDYSSTIAEFLTTYSAELASLSLAAIAAIGIRMALTKAPGAFEPNMLGGITVALTMGIFVMVYVTGAYLLFAPFISLLVITGLGFLIFNVREGMKNGGEDLVKLADIITGIGCFLLGILALFIGGDYALFMAMILFIMGLIFLFKGIKMPSTEGTGSGNASPHVTYNSNNPDDPNNAAPSMNDMDNILDDIEKLEDKQYQFKLALKKLFEELIEFIDDEIDLSAYVPGAAPYDLSSIDATIIGELQRRILVIARMVTLDFKKYFDEKLIKTYLKFINSNKNHLNYPTAFTRLTMLLKDILPEELDFFSNLGKAGSFVTPFKNLIQLIPAGNLWTNPSAITCTFPGFNTSNSLGAGSVAIYPRRTTAPQYNGIIAASSLGSTLFINQLKAWIVANNPTVIALLSALRAYCNFFIEGTTAIGTLNYLIALEVAKLKKKPIVHTVPKNLWTKIWESFQNAHDNKLPTLFLENIVVNPGITYLNMQTPNTNTIVKPADQVIPADLTQVRNLEPTTTKVPGPARNRGSLLFAPILINPSKFERFNPFGLFNRSPLGFPGGGVTQQYELSPTLDNIGGPLLADYKLLFFKVYRTQVDLKVNGVWGTLPSGAQFKVNDSAIPGNKSYVYCMIIPKNIPAFPPLAAIDPEVQADFMARIGAYLRVRY